MNLRHILAVLSDVLLVSNLSVADELIDVGGVRCHLWEAVDCVPEQVEAVQVVQNGHVEWSGSCDLLLVAAYVQVVLIGSAVREPMNERRLAVECKDDRFVRREESIDSFVAQAIGVLALWLELHKIDDVDHPDFQVGKMLSQQLDRRQGLKS